MNKKIKDVTIGDMIDCCNRQQNQSCLNCPLFSRLCGKLPYYINVYEDLDTPIDLGESR